MIVDVLYEAHVSIRARRLFDKLISNVGFYSLNFILNRCCNSRNRMLPEFSGKYSELDIFTEEKGESRTGVKQKSSRA